MQQDFGCSEDSPGESLIRITTRLVCGRETFEVRTQVLINMSLFQQRPELLKEGYYVKSAVDPRIVREFMNAVSGEDIELSDRNICALSDLCNDFGFQGLKSKINEYV